MSQYWYFYEDILTSSNQLVLALVPLVLSQWDMFIGGPYSVKFVQVINALQLHKNNNNFIEQSQVTAHKLY